jgi:hypothetical protein
MSTGVVRFRIGRGGKPKRMPSIGAGSVQSLALRRPAPVRREGG